MTESVSDLTDHLGYRLRQLSNHVSQSFARRLADRDVTVAEWAMMRVMYDHDALPPSRLAERMGMTRGAITKLADRLIAKGLVTRTASAADARAQVLALSTAGRGIVPHLAALADANEAACFAQLTGEERDALRALLDSAIARLGLSAVPVS